MLIGKIAKNYVAGHCELVGSAIARRLQQGGINADNTKPGWQVTTPLRMHRV